MCSSVTHLLLWIMLLDKCKIKKNKIKLWFKRAAKLLSPKTFNVNFFYDHQINCAFLQFYIYNSAICWVAYVLNCLSIWFLLDTVVQWLWRSSGLSFALSSFRSTSLFSNFSFCLPLFSLSGSCFLPLTPPPLVFPLPSLCDSSVGG